MMQVLLILFLDQYSGFSNYDLYENLVINHHYPSLKLPGEYT